MIENLSLGEKIVAEVTRANESIVTEVAKSWSNIDLFTVLMVLIGFVIIMYIVVKT